MPSIDRVRAAVDAYIAAFNAGDKDGWVAGFADDAEQIDPMPGPANVGREAIGEFWDRTRSMAEGLSFEARDMYVCGDEAAVLFTVTGRAGESGVRMEGVDIFGVNEDGKIASLRAYWDPSRIQVLT